jgi:SpoVK/Ycf46/Vps4 family AAA+-type ATPase
MMDEIESLARTREAMHSEPTDSIRIVNSLLVGLDSLKTKKGFFCFMTSNVLDMLDSAVLDRCDLRIKLEAPTWEVRFQILNRDIDKLIEAELILADEYLEQLEEFCKHISNPNVKGKSISGRFVSKLCLLTYSFFVTQTVRATEFVAYMDQYVQKYFYGNKKEPETLR